MPRPVINVRPQVRKLPLYLLLDTSSTIDVESITGLNIGIMALLRALRSDPYFIEILHVSVITFDSETRVLLPLTEVFELEPPPVIATRAVEANLEAAFRTLSVQVTREIIPSSKDQKGDYAGYLFVMLSGEPKEISGLERLSRNVKELGFSKIIGCIVGPTAQKKHLVPFCDYILSIETGKAGGFSVLFEYLYEILQKLLQDAIEAPLSNDTSLRGPMAMRHLILPW